MSISYESLCCSRTLNGQLEGNFCKIIYNNYFIVFPFLPLRIYHHFLCFLSCFLFTTLFSISFLCLFHCLSASPITIKIFLTHDLSRPNSTLLIFRVLFTIPLVKIDETAYCRRTVRKNRFLRRTLVSEIYSSSSRSSFLSFSSYISSFSCLLEENCTPVFSSRKKRHTKTSDMEAINQSSFSDKFYLRTI